MVFLAVAARANCYTARMHAPPQKPHTRAPAKVGLTGGIGCGKSAVAACFRELGVRVIDADAVARELVAPGAAQFDAVVECFGGEIVGADGGIAREKLGALVFASADARKKLEAILHPPIRAEMYARAARARGAYCVLDIPLLVENGQYREMQRVAVVVCARKTRIARLQSARGMCAAHIERVMKTQASESERRAVADDIIDNNGARDALMPQVRALHEKYLRLFSG